MPQGADTGVLRGVRVQVAEAREAGTVRGRVRHRGQWWRLLPRQKEQAAQSAAPLWRQDAVHARSGRGPQMCVRQMLLTPRPARHPGPRRRLVRRILARFVLLPRPRPLSLAHRHVTPPLCRLKRPCVDFTLCRDYFSDSYLIVFRDEAALWFCICLFIRIYLGSVNNTYVFKLG